MIMSGSCLDLRWHTVGMKRGIAVLLAATVVGALASGGVGAAQPAWPATAAAAVAPATGYVINFNGGVYTLDTTTMTSSPLASTGVTGLFDLAAANDGALYAIGATGDADSLYTINRTTGSVSDPLEITALPESNTYYSALGTSSSGRLYAEFVDTTLSNMGRLLVVNRSTGAVTTVGPARSGVLTALAGGCNGKLFGIDDGGDLVLVNTSNGTFTQIGDLDIPNPDGVEVVQELAMDHGTRVLYAFSVSSNSQHERLWRVSGDGQLTATSYAPGAIDSLSGLAFDSPMRCRYSRAVTLSYSKSRDRFSGALTSGWSPCIANQKVQVWRKRSGADTKVGTATTGNGGGFKLSKELNRGRYYAVAPQSFARGTCLRDQSPTVEL
jgi:hypothetical protein